MRQGNELAAATRGHRVVEGENRFETLFRTYVPYVRRVVPRMGVASGDTDDVVQEVFLVVHGALGGFEGRSSERTWIYGICLRVCSNYRRRAYRRRELTMAEPPAAEDFVHPERMLSARTDLQLLDAALADLNDAQRATFVLHEIEQLPMADIATILGCSKFTAYARLYAARRHVVAALTAAQRAGDRHA